MTSIGRRGLSQAKSSLATKFDGRVTLPLADVLERVIQLQDQVAELTRIVTVQIDVANQTTELLGRLIATSSSRLDELETALAKAAPNEEGSPVAKRTSERRPRAKLTAKEPASERASQP